MLRILSGLALASGLAIATGPPVFPPAFAQGMPMGTMKTTTDPDDQNKPTKPAKEETRDQAPNQAQAPERVTPTYRDTVEDRIMREKTDDGAHDPKDMKR